MDIVEKKEDEILPTEEYKEMKINKHLSQPKEEKLSIWQEIESKIKTK